MATKSKYGNEEKDRLKGYLSQEEQEATSYILSEMQFVVINASLWHYKQPWKVPERRISDNLILIGVDGQFDITVESNTWTVERGDCVFITENTKHSFRLHSACEAASNFIIHALPVYPSIRQPFGGLDSVFQKLKYPEATLSALYRGVAMRNYNQEEAFAYVGGVLQSILLDTVSDGHYHATEENYTSSRIKNAYWFIHERFAEDFSISDVAESVNLKEVQFRRIFRRETGFSPNAYIHRFRLLQAARLLTRYDYPMKEIARHSGFNSTSYFCSSFLKYFKTTPEKFRRNRRS